MRDKHDDTFKFAEQAASWRCWQKEGRYQAWCIVEMLN